MQWSTALRKCMKQHVHELSSHIKKREKGVEVSFEIEGKSKNETCLLQVSQLHVRPTSRKGDFARWMLHVN
jgi:hypothetical protein